MPPQTQVRTRKMTIVAQDPGIRANGRILTTQVDVPAEELARGPRGYRVHVIDYDASTRTLYKPHRYPPSRDGTFVDPFEKCSNSTILNDPGFHAQNVYAIVMRTLARFEFALGRRTSWGFPGHQLKVAPHAFADANAFYSNRDEALMFGYFPGDKGTVFSCLSHDVIAHETTHALLDGLRSRYTDPSSPDQAAFHEGFADIAALLSVFSLRDVVKRVLDMRVDERRKLRGDPSVIHVGNLKPKLLRRSLLFALAEQMGKELSTSRGKALRQSAELDPSPKYLKMEEYLEPHRRGEILVAAVMNTLLDVLNKRITSLGFVRAEYLDRERVAEEAAEAANYLLTMVIRALDYTPPMHIEFGDFLSALLTADHEIRPDDSKYCFRASLLGIFGEYGIKPASLTKHSSETGLWGAPRTDLVYDRCHFEALSRDPDEMFRFVWENRKDLKLFEGAYTRIESLRPCLRIAPIDGFPLREIVTECIQLLELEARELRRLRIRKPDGMPNDTKVRLSGGVTLIFNEFGRVKFDIGTYIRDDERQEKRLQYLWDYGYFESGSDIRRRFATMHRMRGMQLSRQIHEEW